MSVAMTPSASSSAAQVQDSLAVIKRGCDELLVEQEMAVVVVYRRTENGFVNEVYQGLDAVLALDEVGINLPLAEIYEKIEFVPEEDD